MAVLRILLVVSQGDFYCATSLRYKNENLALNERLHFISLKKAKSQDNTSIFDVEKSVKELARFNETSLSEKIQPTIKKKNRNKKRFFFLSSFRLSRLCQLFIFFTRDEEKEAELFFSFFA